MNKQIPDELEFSSERYPLYPVPPLLAPGHPRWEYCLFARTLNTADFRAYRARWSIRDGYLYLIGFGGATEDELGLLLDGERLQIGMVDVHETDAPVPGLASVQWRAVWWAIPLSNSVGLLKPSAE